MEAEFEWEIENFWFGLKYLFLVLKELNWYELKIWLEVNFGDICNPKFLNLS